MKRLWEAEPSKVPSLLDEFWAAREIPNAGRGLPTMILYLKDPESYNILIRSTGKGASRVLGKPVRGRSGAVYRTFNNTVRDLRKRLEIPNQLVDLALWKLSKPQEPAVDEQPKLDAERAFRGFDTDAFAFFGQLDANNTQTWFDSNKKRFRDRVKEPLRMLVTDIGSEFFAAYAPHLEREPKHPNTLSGIRKNIYGRKGVGAYWDHLWAAFHRKERKKTDDFQLFVAIHRDRLNIAFTSFAADMVDVERFRERLGQNSAQAARTLETIREAGLKRLRIHDESDFAVEKVPELEELLREPVSQALAIGRTYASDDPALRSPSLVDDAVEVYAALYPLYLLATHAEPTKAIAEFEEHWGGRTDEVDEPELEEAYTLERLLEETLLPRSTIDTLVELIATKGQLIFYGPPGTGKTWLAERFGQYLAGPNGEVKTIQFHPSYSYEDFVEGIRPRTANGQVSYEVVPGIFRRFCDEARRRPKARFVLVIDEINRGNLPRIFGELLYLLERRAKEVELPVSGSSFSVPSNLILIGTMNTADQSIALLDMALRRRFHFERFDPDADLLADWLGKHRPDMKVAAEILIRVNQQLESEGISSDRWIGHSHFMDEHLDEDRLERVWNHSVLPTIEELFYSQPERLAEFRYEALVEPLLSPIGGDETSDEDEQTNDADTH